MRLSSAFLAAVLATGCLPGNPPGVSSSSSGAGGSVGAAGGAPAHCATVAQLQAWQAEIDQFDGGYRPTGSPAHEAYIAHLQSELTALGVSDVHTEPFAFTKWTPSTWSLALLDGPSAGPVTLSGYVPYSGSTGPTGVVSGMVYLPSFTIPLDPTSLASELADPTSVSKTLSAQIQTAIAAL